MICGARLRQVREARSMSQKQLAEAVGLPQPYVSQLESDSRLVDATVHRRIADALGVSAPFLTRTPMSLPEGSLGTFRSLRSKVASTDFHAARRKAEMGIEAVWRLAEKSRLPTCRIEAVPDSTPDEAAVYARSMLRLPPDAPIGHLTRALERAGALVFSVAGLHEDIHGFSAWAPEPLNRPVVVGSRYLSPFRLRFTLAHELGHLVMGHQVYGRPTKDPESEANRFAGTFLLPEEAMHDVFAAPIDLRRLAEIKGVWGASMMAVLMRAKGMGYVDEPRFRSLYEVMRRKGWLKTEPGDLTTEAESPRLIQDLARVLGVSAEPEEFVFRFDFSIRDAEELITL